MALPLPTIFFEMTEFFNANKDSRECLYSLFLSNFNFNKYCSEQDFIESEIERLSLLEWDDYKRNYYTEKQESEEEYENRKDYERYIWNNMVNYYTKLVHDSVEEYNNTNIKYIAKTKGLPIFKRLDNSNIRENDIITLKVKKSPIFCKIVGETPTMIKVVELYAVTNNGITKFIEKSIVNSVTKNYLDKKRKINWAE
jgi:hypothetical protein